MTALVPPVPASPEEPTTERKEATMDEQEAQRLAAGPDMGALDGFGGYLRCETCRREQPLGNPGERVLGGGWPKCCGHTMRWWTQRQIDAGEERILEREVWQ